MGFAANALGVITAHIQLRRKDRVQTERIGVALESFFRHFSEAHAFNCCCGAGEIFLHEV